MIGLMSVVNVDIKKFSIRNYTEQLPVLSYRNHQMNLEVKSVIQAAGCKISGPESMLSGIFVLDDFTPCHNL